MGSKTERKTAMPPFWQQIHGAIWLIGLAVLAWQNWWWPGILILVALSGVAEAIIRRYVEHSVQQKVVQQEVATARAHLPENCPNCGGPLARESLTWVDATTAQCPYCGTRVKSQQDTEQPPLSVPDQSTTST